MKVTDPVTGKEHALPGILYPENNPGYRMAPPSGASRCWADFDGLTSGCGLEGVEKYAGLCPKHHEEIAG